MNYCLLLVFCCLPLITTGQEKGVVYILFSQNASATCNYISNRETQKEINLKYIQKRHRKVNITRFILCRNIFVFEWQKHKFETVGQASISGYKIITLDEILAQEQKSGYRQTINELFPEIFILEEIENGEYAKYQVVWEKAQ